MIIARPTYLSKYYKRTVESLLSLSDIRSSFAYRFTEREPDEAFSILKKNINWLFHPNTRTQRMEDWALDLHQDVSKMKEKTNGSGEVVRLPGALRQDLYTASLRTVHNLFATLDFLDDLIHGQRTVAYGIDLTKFIPDARTYIERTQVILKDIFSTIKELDVDIFPYFKLLMSKIAFDRGGLESKPHLIGSIGLREDVIAGE